MLSRTKEAFLRAHHTLIVCSKCKGTNIKIMDWVDPNSGEWLGGSEPPEPCDTYCDTCEDSTGVETNKI